MNNSNAVSSGRFWLYFWSTIMILAAIFLTAVYKANHNQPNVQATADGKHILLSAEMAEAWEKSAPGIFSSISNEFNSATRAEIEKFIDTQIDAVFEPVYGQIPAFSDFHYSLTGEYTEIVAALTGEMSNRVQSILFNQVGFEGHLQNSFTQIAEKSKDKVSGAMSKVNSDIQGRIGLTSDDMNLINRVLHLTIEDMKNRFSSLEYSTIRGAGLALGLTATGAVLAKTLGKKVAVKVGAKVAAKTAAKAGGIAAGAGTGAGACAVGGPIAMAVCAAGGALLVWATVDKVIVEIDEYFNRGEFEQELRVMIDDQKQEIKQGLKNAYTTMLSAISEEQKSRLKQGIVTPRDLVTE